MLFISYQELERILVLMNTFQLLEEIRGIAKNGLHYSKNEYDQERYNRLLELCCQKYSEILGLDLEIALQIFLKEAGNITPKIGVNSAIFDNDKLLITKRLDDKCWELPGGWAELGEAPGQTVERELKEETSIIIKAINVIDVFTRLPGDFNQTFTSYHILYDCIIIEGDFRPSNETTEIMFIDRLDINDVSWHRDHFSLAKKAFEYKSI